MGRGVAMRAACAGALLFMAGATLATADSVARVAAVESYLTASRVIRAGEVIGQADVARKPGVAAGALGDPDGAIGLEARVTLYPGRPIAAGDLTAPAMVERNQIVTIRFVRGGLTIETDGRALDRGANGGRIRVMNLTSRATVIARVTGADMVEVGR
jgi:flagella basal body P-ring formation protein FlgA